jgi:hypothetical protein
MAAVDICNMALSLLKVPTVTSITSPTTEIEELCDLWYEPSRQELLRKHPWNFAKKRATLYSIVTDPTFGYDYKYLLPTDFMRLRFIGTDNEGLVGKDYDLDQDQYLLTDDGDTDAEGTDITDITTANPGVVTAASHGFSNGEVAIIEDVVGMTEVNDLHFTVANATTDTFELQSQAATPVDVDTSGYTAYSSGGTVKNAPSLNIGYVFDEDDTDEFDPLFTKALALQIAVNLSYGVAGKTTLRTDVRNMLTEALQEARAINGQDKPPVRVTRSRVIGARRRYSSGIGYEGNPSRIPD